MHSNSATNESPLHVSLNTLTSPFQNVFGVNGSPYYLNLSLIVIEVVIINQAVPERGTGETVPIQMTNIL